MNQQVAFSLKGRNPDILTSIANLSNDEVFTPPDIANQMLDLVEQSWAHNHDGSNIWSDPQVTFIDPFTKSGVFLREVTKRLVNGLEDVFPDLQQRVDHVLSNQVFGIAITELTALLARRSLYCSKWANGPHSISTLLGSQEGRIWFERTEHTWKNGRCSFCGAARGAVDRGPDLETHAYDFIHTSDIHGRMNEIFGEEMQFDVVIGNPPYQLQSDGGTRDIPIYQHFVEQAKRLQPRILSMVIPSRWMASGLGLSSFRETMLSDRRLKALVDYPVANEVFPNVEVKAGVCYFLWEFDYAGPCAVRTIREGVESGPVDRRLDDYDIFVRDSKAVPILEKVLRKGEEPINSILAVDKEFGWTSNFSEFHDEQDDGDIPLHFVRKGVRSVGFVSRGQVTKSEHLIDKWKVLVPKSGSDGGQKIPNVVLGKPLIAASPSVCTQSFLFFIANSENEAISIQSYYCSRFFRFLVSLRKITQDATHSTYSWVPMQAWDRVWTDDELFAKYQLSESEIAYVEQMIKPMEIPVD